MSLRRVKSSGLTGTNMNSNNLLVASFPRRRESSKKAFRIADISMVLPRYAGLFNQLDSRLRGNDSVLFILDSLE